MVSESEQLDVTEVVGCRKGTFFLKDRALSAAWKEHWGTRTHVYRADVLASILYSVKSEYLSSESSV